MMKSDQLPYWVECTISGVGQEFVGTFSDLLEFVKNYHRRPEWPVAVWFNGRKIVQNGPTLWIHPRLR